MRLFLIFTLLFLYPGLQAQDPEFSADVADPTMSPQTLKSGALQLEMSAIVTRYRDLKRQSGIIQTFLRYGISRRVEIGLLAEDGLNRHTYVEETVQGMFPLALSGKYQFRSKKGKPELGVAAFLKLPFTAQTSEEHAYWSPSIVLAAARKLSDVLDIKINFGIQEQTDSDEFFWPASASLNYKRGRLGVFADYYGQFEKKTTPFHNAGGGITYLLTEKSELHLVGGSSLKGSPANHYCSLGFAVQF